MESIEPNKIITKLCKNTFGKFAYSQIKKAKGLNKKIVNPIIKDRKSVLDFCYINYKQGAIPLLKFLELKHWKQENCGLINIPHMRDVFGLYYSETENFSGIIRNENSNDVCVSSIPKGLEQLALLYFNRDGYSTHCKEHKEYWDWVDKRNQERYQDTQSHGKNYDAKNMMHVFRLLEMACEIGREQKINVKRPNRDFLLEIKSGKFEYDDLLKMAENLQLELDQSFENTTLLDTPNIQYINEIAYKIREEFYSQESICV